jgi:hypothetical protein
MSDPPLHERIERHRELTDELADVRRERDAVATEISTRLEDTLAEAVDAEGVTVETVERSRDGRRFRFAARLDRAALVAALTETLPDGFYVSHVNDDGSLSVDWSGQRETPSKREHGSVLKAIVAEETVTDADGFYESVPSRERVIERAVELGIDEDDATARLDRLATLDVVDVTDDGVYPDENFAMV